MSNESPHSSSTEEITAQLQHVENRKRSSRSPSPSSKNQSKTVVESRRAEQNRAAQRAFRQRKERYVKELEAKVNSMADWPARMEHLESENEALQRKISELLIQQEENKKKMFILDNSSSIKSSSSNKKFKTSIHSPPSTPSLGYPSSLPQSTSLTTANTQQPQNTTTTTTPRPTGEKGRVLDDLVSILRTRHRPPIPSHPPN
jgi:monoamine oxidase